MSFAAQNISVCAVLCCFVPDLVICLHHNSCIVACKHNMYIVNLLFQVIKAFSTFILCWKKAFVLSCAESCEPMI